MPIRKLLILLAILAASPARADVGLGLFLGEPTGLDLKLGLTNRTGIDIVLGVHEVERNYYGGDYGHLTYLVTPFVSRGQSVIVPFRIGIGIAFLDDGRAFGESIAAAVRAPVQIGFRFRSVPLEIYGELSLLIPIIRHSYLDGDGGIGFRIYF